MTEWRRANASTTHRNLKRADLKPYSVQTTDYAREAVVIELLLLLRVPVRIAV